MFDPFLTFINQHHLDLRSQPCVLAVSGGVDSVVMLHLFHKMAFPAIVAHCNFGLRGEESEGDEQFVKVLAETYGLPFHSKHFDVKSFAKDKGISTQMAAREQRYDWFQQLRTAHDHTYIATAHHANDSLETTLLNLTRGTGLSGLHGISGINNHLLRPLLLATKEQVLLYAQENGLSWREDRSNDSDDYKRNLIRHRVVPVLKQLNPSLEETFKYSSVKLRSADLLLKEMLDEWAAGVVVEEGNQVRISKERLISGSHPAYRLWHILQAYGFAYQQVEKITNSLQGISGKHFQSASYTLLIDRNDLILKKAEPNQSEKTASESDREIQIEENQKEARFAGRNISLTKKFRNPEESFATSRSTVSVDFQKLVFPLKVRRWKLGDTFQPFGMHGRRKKLSDLFIDLKMDQFAKEKALVLLNGNEEVIWVIGIRMDERFRVEEGTDSVLEVVVN